VPASLIGRRVTACCLLLAPLCEVVEGLLSPLTNQSTSADLAAIDAHQAAFAASTLVGLLGTLLYVPAFLGLLSHTVTRTRRVSLVAAGFLVAAELGFAGVRMGSGVELQVVRDGLVHPATLVDHGFASPVVAATMVLFLAGLAVGVVLLGFAVWRSGLSRAAAVWLWAFPVVTLADDLHWANVATHTAHLVALGWVGWRLLGGTLAQGALLGRRATAVLLVTGGVLEVVEQLLSPLATTSTAADLAAIDADQGRFVLSVLIGLAATVLYLPAFLGLAGATVAASPAAARIGAAFAGASMLGFVGVRVVQGFELTAARDLDRAPGARLIDHVATNPVGATVLALFLGGSVLGLVALAVAAWRAGLPRPATVLLGAFPLADLAMPGHAGTVVSHLVLLGALTWLATALAGRSPRTAVEEASIVSVG
jgi:hypothetical protein